MGDKKMGRPTNNPQNAIIKTRADKETVEKLRICSEKLRITRSDVIRKGINMVYDSLKN